MYYVINEIGEIICREDSEIVASAIATEIGGEVYEIAE